MAGSAGFEPAYRCLTNNFITIMIQPNTNRIFLIVNKNYGAHGEFRNLDVHFGRVTLCL